jgi:hypothetical protein
VRALTEPALGTTCVVTVCRGCCCGTDAKHPGVDHDGHLAALRAAEGGRVREGQCLAACELSNMVVVNPSPAGRAEGGRPTWLGGVLSDDEVALVVRWVEAGGPGVAPLPAALATNVEAVRAFAERTAQQA